MQDLVSPASLAMMNFLYARILTGQNIGGYVVWVVVALRLKPLKRVEPKS
jgi:hypothetical protein